MESNNKTHSLLIVDDEAGIRHGLVNWFDEKYNVFDFADYNSAIQCAKQRNIDIAVLDIRLNDKHSGIDLFRKLKVLNPEIIVILITGYGSLNDAVATLKEGAKDYLLKPVDNNKLTTAIEKSLEIDQLKKENLILKNELKKHEIPHTLVTQNKTLLNIKAQIDAIKDNPVPILLTGESGTGKEVFARYIHSTSKRRDNSFLAVNCAAIVDSLLLSELFGHEKGAFTGANVQKIGKFEQAHSGHLFLDEIGDMSMANQASLLRILETQSFERVGGNKTIKIDTSIITATNKNIKTLVEQKLFREDLYYRINVAHFEIPPLRERKDDIPLLANHFLKKYVSRYQKKNQKFDDAVLRLFEDYSWPGNIRELNNVINRIVLLCNSEVIKPDDIDYSTLKVGEIPTDELDYNDVNSVNNKISSMTAYYERKMIEIALKRNHYNRSKTASHLQMTRKTLARKIARYDIKFE